MKISELQEALSKHALSWGMERRKAAHDAKQPAVLVSVKKDGNESKMHDAKTYHASEQAARKKHADIVGLNPGRNIRHNLYVDGKLVGMLDKDTLAEVSHRTGFAALKTLHSKPETDAHEQQAAMQKFSELTSQEKEIMRRPDSATGKYAKDLIKLSRQKTSLATKHKLNAQGQPLEETASSGSTAAGSIASVANPLLDIQRRPSLFGYIPSKTKRKSTKSK